MIRPYIKDGKKLYFVAVYQKDRKGKQLSRKQSTVVSERKAKELEFQFKNELRQRAGESFKWTWGAWLKECLKRMQLSLKRSTVMDFEGTLKKWVPESLDTKLLEQITAQDIYDILFSGDGKNLTAHNKVRVLRKMKRIFQMGVEEGILTKNPTLQIKLKAPKTQQKVLTMEEAGRLLHEAFTNRHRFYEVWALALKTGMRSGEMFALRWGDIDFERGFISINKQWTNKDGLTLPKNRESRLVPMNEDLTEFLESLKAKNQSNAQEIWVSQLKKKVKYSDFVLPRLKEWENGDQAMVLRDFCKTIGVTSIRFHDLRATFITNLLAQGAPLVQVMSIVGHRRMATTDVYLRMAGVQVADTTQKLGYRLPKSQPSTEVPKTLSPKVA